MSSTREDVAALAEAMRKAHVFKATFRANLVTSIELHPSAFSPAPAPIADDPTPRSTLCACDHDIETQHGPGGCLTGCALEKCIPEEKGELDEP